jgi:plastocyanin
MKFRRNTLIATAMATSCVVLAGMTPAVAQAPKRVKLAIVGDTVMKAGQFIRDDQRFTPANRVVRSGGTVRLTNKAKTEDPHTLSIVKKSDLPKTAAQALNCEPCGPIFASHGDPESADFKPLVDVGAAGFDQPGDSIFIPPGGGGTIRFDVTAAKGKSLYYLCLIHPWMQGRLRVK